MSPLSVLAASDLPPLEHAPDGVRDAARELLSRPPYRDEAAGPLARAVEWLREQVARIIDAVLAVIGGDTAIAWVVVVVGTALLLVAVWYWTRGLSLDRSVATVPSARPTRTAASWVTEAMEHEAAGRWRDAVRCRYAALVAALTEAGTVDDVPGRTVRELDREVAAAAPELGDVVRAAGERFEAVWYGHATADPDDARTVAQAVDAVRSSTGHAVPA